MKKFAKIQSVHLQGEPIFFCLSIFTDNRLIPTLKKIGNRSRYFFRLYLYSRVFGSLLNPTILSKRSSSASVDQL